MDVNNGNANIQDSGTQNIVANINNDTGNQNQDSQDQVSIPEQSNAAGNSNAVAQQDPEYNAYNFWSKDKQENAGKAVIEKKPMPPENQVAMYQRLLDKQTRQLTEMQAKFESLQSGNQNAPQNILKKQNIEDAFSQGNDLDRSVYEALNEKLEAKLNSFEEQQFQERVAQNAEKYISRIENLPDEISNRFLDTVQSDTVRKGLKEGLIGFEDVYKILTYDSLVAKLNSLSVSQRNRQNQDISAGGGNSSGEMQDASMTKDFFALNPDKANDLDFVMEYKRKKGLL
jgi:hypothetical protein